MIDVLITNSDEINWIGKDKEGFQPAHTFGKAEIILLSKIPKGHEEQIEEKIENILEHEQIHIILAKCIGERESFLYDKIFPFDTDLREFLYE